MSTATSAGAQLTVQCFPDQRLDILPKTILMQFTHMNTELEGTDELFTHTYLPGKYQKAIELLCLKKNTGSRLPTNWG